MKTVKNTIGEKQARLKSLSTVGNPDNKAIVKAASEIGDLKTKIFVNQVQTKQQVRALLDEKQKMKFDQMGDKMRQGKGKGNGQGRPDHMKRG
jgi:Spy/CpxP family protein refolding chaperone